MPDCDLCHDVIRRRSRVGSDDIIELLHKCQLKKKTKRDLESLLSHYRNDLMICKRCYTDLNENHDKEVIEKVIKTLDKNISKIKSSIMFVDMTDISKEREDNRFKLRKPGPI